MKRNRESGIYAAKQFGSEFQANPGSSKREYLDSSAYYFGENKNSFSDLSDEEKKLCQKAFLDGIAAEKALQRRLPNSQIS